MESLTRRPARLLLILVGVLAPAAVRAVDPPAKPLERKELDQRLYTIVTDVINAGADLYNEPNGDKNGCYRLYEGALRALAPLVDHRPDWQEAVKKGLEDAKAQHDAGKAAHVLRGVLGKMRTDLKAATTAKATLWDRLGGEAGVKKVVDDFVELVGKDPKVDFFRGGKYKTTDVAQLKKSLVEFTSSISGGPLPYTGKSMKDVHKGMGIKDGEFDTAAADLRKALEKNNVKPDAISELMLHLAGTRQDIVEPGK